MIASITSFVGKVVATVREPIFGVKRPKARVGKSAKSKRCSRKCRCN
ncbi:MAG: hypothetical protein PHV13_05085 [Candidatus ainarchaeum sp.]|nr:hypothetical protein [Candidatus ainarchaeum sp.]